MADSTTPARIFIYVLKDPRTSEVRYIGKTNDLQKRYTHHICSRDRDRSYRANWIRSLKRQNLKPIMEVVEETDELQWQERERYWIAYGHEQGWKLTNGDDGGSGGKSPTPETLTKLQISHLGFKHTPESKAKMSLKFRGRITSEATKEKFRNRPHTWGDKISAAKMGHEVAESARQKMSEAKYRHFDKIGRHVDKAVEYLETHPQDANLSCRQLGKMLGVKHEVVSEAKARLGIPLKRSHYNPSEKNGE